MKANKLPGFLKSLGMGSAALFFMAFLPEGAASVAEAEFYQVPAQPVIAIETSAEPSVSAPVKMFTVNLTGSQLMTVSLHADGSYDLEVNGQMLHSDSNGEIQYGKDLTLAFQFEDRELTGWEERYRDSSGGPFINPGIDRLITLEWDSGSMNYLVKTVDVTNIDNGYVTTTFTLNYPAGTLTETNPLETGIAGDSVIYVSNQTGLDGIRVKFTTSGTDVFVSHNFLEIHKNVGGVDHIFHNPDPDDDIEAGRRYMILKGVKGPHLEDLDWSTVGSELRNTQFLRGELGDRLVQIFNSAPVTLPDDDKAFGFTYGNFVYYKDGIVINVEKADGSFVGVFQTETFSDGTVRLIVPVDGTTRVYRVVIDAEGLISITFEMEVVNDTAFGNGRAWVAVLPDGRSEVYIRAGNQLIPTGVQVLSFKATPTIPLVVKTPDGRAYFEATGVMRIQYSVNTDLGPMTKTERYVLTWVNPAGQSGKYHLQNRLTNWENARGERPQVVRYTYNSSGHRILIVTERNMPDGSMATIIERVEIPYGTARVRTAAGQVTNYRLEIPFDKHYDSSGEILRYVKAIDYNDPTKTILIDLSGNSVVVTLDT